MTEPVVSVGILNSPFIEFDLDGDFKAKGIDGLLSGKFKASLIENKIVLDKEGKKIFAADELMFEPVSFKSDSFLLRNVIIGVKFHWERKENQRFLGALKFIKENGKLTAVNMVPIESYLTSVISSEMSATSSLELLKAHSIISRSWLLAQIEKSKSLTDGEKYTSFFSNEEEIVKWYDREDHKFYDVCADDHCQRYQGITKSHTEAVKIAIEATRGLVLSYNDKICDARFSKSCGGISESFENVWEPVKHPYLSAITDYKYEQEDYNMDFSNEKNAEKWIRSNPPAFCNTTDKKVLSQVLNDYDQTTTDFYRWKVTYSQEELSKLITEKSGIDFGQIVDLIPGERGYSARLISLKIVGTRKTLTIGKELEIRKTLSTSHLYSSAFIVEKGESKSGIPSSFTLIGAGWGHGVGLCQIGAAVMGEKGYKFDEILLHYFKHTVLKKLYA
jgi:SpoIID/LytB domain protein